jgi:site-specific DNA-methyltransferase (adenine-specific)
MDSKIWISVNKINVHPKNPRKHTQEQIEKIANSIKELGWGRPIIISKDNFILAGHGAFIAATEILKLKSVPYRMMDHVHDSPKALSYMIADNKLTDESDWNYGKLEPLIDRIDLEGFDLSLTGFEEKERKELPSLNPENKVNAVEDDFDPDEEIESIVQPRQIWQLGDHKLMCGDSTSSEDVEKLMDENKADMVFTDPPYNVNYDPEQRHSSFSTERTKKKLGTILNDNKSQEDFKAFLDATYSNIDRSIKAGRGIYIFHADTEGHNFRKAFIDQEWKLQSCLIWLKTQLVLGRADYHWIHEPILYGWKEGEAHRWCGNRKQTSVIEMATDHHNQKELDTEGYVHPTQKPIKLIAIFINNSSYPNEIVLDLFGGSGATLIACEQTKRICYMMELDPHYCDVIIKRWEEFTGKNAVLLN